MNLDELIKQLLEHKRVYGGGLEVRFNPTNGEPEWIASAEFKHLPTGKIIVMLD